MTPNLGVRETGGRPIRPIDFCGHPFTRTTSVIPLTNNTKSDQQVSISKSWCVRLTLTSVRATAYMSASILARCYAQKAVKAQLQSRKIKLAAGKSIERRRPTWLSMEQNCWKSGCHGDRPYSGGFTLPHLVPALVGPGTLSHFATVADLFTFISKAMPFQAPGSLKRVATFCQNDQPMVELKD